MTSGRRLEKQGQSPFEAGERVRFYFEGRAVDGFAQEPVAVALLAAGVRIFGRSLKYHRPRGAVCLDGHCSSCLLRIDGVANVRSCQTLCRAGMVVERQSGWPSPKFDVLRAVDWFAGDRLDHHSLFTTSSVVNRVATGFVRKLSGLGDPPTAEPPAIAELRNFAAEVVVIGGGTAGLAAASQLAEAGHQVILFEKSHHLGGRLLDGACRLGEPEKDQPGWEILGQWKSQWQSHAGLEIHRGTTVLAVYEGDRPQVLASNQETTYLIDAQRLIICTGAYEQLPLFINNDLPGLLSIRALDKLFYRYGVVPAEPLVLVGNSDRCLRLAYDLAKQGVKLAGLVTQTQASEGIEKLKQAGVPLFFDRRVLRARGGRWLDRLELAGPDHPEPDLVLDCQACALEGPSSPAYELAHHAGCRVSFHSHSGYVVTTNEDGRTSHGQIFAAGHCAGALSCTEARQQGEQVGRACARCLHSVSAEPGGQHG